MVNFFLGFSLLLGLGAAVWAVLAAQNLQKTYGVSALSTFLYYQIFVAVFGLYGVAGPGIVKMIMVSRNSSFQTVETVWHLFSVLGAPFLILAWSMFLRLSREISDETPGWATTRGFLFAAFALYIGYGTLIVILNLSLAGDAAWKAFSTTVKGFFVGLDSVVIAASTPRLLWRSGSIADGAKRSAIRAFGWAATAAWVGRFIFFIISDRGGVFFSLFILVFFAGTVLPLITWRTYLIKNVPAPEGAGTTVSDIKKFSGAFNISRREEEVIRQVLDGKTNKEIAASLYITVQTVKDHLYRVFQKADVRNRVQLVKLVQSYGADERKDSDEV